jgi:hypothetical protein
MATPKKQTLSASAAALGLPTSALAKPKPTPTPTPKPAPKKPAPKPAAPEVPKGIASTLTQLETESAAATTDINTAMAEGAAAAAAAESDVVAATEAAKEANKIKPGSASTNLIAPDGTVFQDATAYAAYVGYLSDKQSAFDTQKRSSQSAFDLMYAEFANYGLASLVEPLRGLVQNGISGDEFTLRLRETDAYKKRFSANAERIAKGLTALSEGEYLDKEDKYQAVMRNYDLPASYYAKDSLGTQAGFQKLLANDVSAVELEDRLIQAKDRVINANPEVSAALKAYYPGIGDGDILAYVLDPQNALKDIQRKVSAAEIGGAARAQGLTTGVSRAEELAGLGITKAQAQAGYTNVAEMAPRGSELSAIYGQGPYGQTEAEAEVFNTAGAAEAAKKRKKIVALEQAQFSGSSGVGALGRDKAIYGSAFGQQGQY